ncbi:putative porin [Alteromonas sp. A079]|uniref:putative porin n=1 Tax=Alteromonas sp. A079 TaxID=3410268 RepID=UPI003B9E9986
MLTRSIRFSATAAALFFTQQACAEEYQTFIAASILSSKSSLTQDGQTTSDTNNLWSVNGTYFLDPRTSLGPLNEFDYIIQQSSVSAGLLGDGGNRQYVIGGEYIANDWVVFGDAVYMSDSDTEILTVGFGYFLTKDIKLSISNTSNDGISGLADSDESFFKFTADYVLQLGDKDYVGFTYNTDEDLNVQQLRTKYFGSLSNGRYVVLNADLSIFDDDVFSDDTLSLGGAYYFNQFTSVGAGINVIGDTDSYSIFAKHFFNTRSSLQVSYSSSERTNVDSGFGQFSFESDSWQVNYVYQY